MMNWMKAKLEACGAKCKLKDIGEQTLLDRTKIPLPPVLLGSLGDDSNKKTVLVYGHLDVQPAVKGEF
ncbi:cytosolic non-specific dipeptidase-like [Tropilaelaps mercedesae]|uniref:Cytosolic non-specific dipeptidase-like n=1 Tax=Tropilaelaps mercedesae TaxID=418985 RepID=A0A1V9XEG0_9ACAR|nr:cytosolic non-specific dipeptidase-like [Tropilaelaps mercedesae]